MKNTGIVSDQVEVSLLGIELDGETAHVPRQVARALAASHRRKAREDRRFLALAL
jgi:hypothetical protein